MSMSGKCTYLEKVGAVHFARKRIRRAGTGRVEPRDALTHPTRRLIDGQLLRPEEVIGDDLARRRVPAATVASHWKTRWQASKQPSVLPKAAISTVAGRSPCTSS